MKKFLISTLCALLVISSAGCSLAADKADGYPFSPQNTEAPPAGRHGIDPRSALCLVVRGGDQHPILPDPVKQRRKLCRRY